MKLGWEGTQSRWTALGQLRAHLGSPGKPDTSQSCTPQFTVKGSSLRALHGHGMAAFPRGSKVLADDRKSILGAGHQGTEHLLWPSKAPEAPGTCDAPSGRPSAAGCSPVPAPTAPPPAAPAAQPALTPSGSAGSQTGPGEKRAG